MLERFRGGLPVWVGGGNIAIVHACAIFSDIFVGLQISVPTDFIRRREGPQERVFFIFNGFPVFGTSVLHRGGVFCILNEYSVFRKSVLYYVARGLPSDMYELCSKRYLRSFDRSGICPSKGSSVFGRKVLSPLADF